MAVKLFAGNLPWTLGDDSLKSTFEPYGKVVNARIIKDRDTGKSRGFGFVEMEDNAEAEKAMQALNGSELNGRKIIVNEAKAR
ncbi:MAG: RNA-binding protein [Ignavibacteriales bacterium]|nr:RNA-binding protein [Ignavibacteriaceae bacterium]QOJ28230.1 MAG: RNA-binding protein [Ignavibacteriales bacterium]